MSRQHSTALSFTHTHTHSLGQASASLGRAFMERPGIQPFMQQTKPRTPPARAHLPGCLTATFKCIYKLRAVNLALGKMRQKLDEGNS